MEQHAALPLAAWEAFYVIIGSSAAALTGLQFVVIALVAERRRPNIARLTAVFATPTVVYFASVLLLSAFLSAPWRSLHGAGALVGMVGAVGLVYAVLIVRRARRVTGYQPVLEDWIWHGLLPVIAYVNLIAQGLAVRTDPGLPLFLIGASAVLLLFIGIHNAWDTATYVVTERPPVPGQTPGDGPPGA